MKIRIGEGELKLLGNGQIEELSFRDGSIFPKGQFSWLIRAFRDGKEVGIRLVDREKERILYHWEKTEEPLVMQVTEKETYTVFTVLECPDSFDFLEIGPIVTSLNEVVGDVIGVVQGGMVAIGIQALNVKTLAGFPYELKDQVIHRKETPTSELTVSSLDFSMAAAYDMPFGSVLQLYCENRRRDRIKTVCYAENCIPAPKLERDDADIKGCSFALFACEKEAALAVIGEIEMGEGLPHPMLVGEWLKTSRKAVCSYMISEFGVDNIDKMLAYAKKGGFSYLYHPEPFDTWGHFELRKDQFPQGDTSLKECVEKAEAQGVKTGLHTLTNFTRTNDSYVTPIPDKRLKAMVPVKLLEEISAEETELRIDELKGFAYAATLNSFRIGDELLQYQECKPDQEKGILLTGCTRGAFGTTAAGHPKGAEVYKLTDYPYQTLFPDIDLQDEFSDRIAELFNKTGLNQISFDGQEGCEWTGEGEYAVNRFAMRCYEQFDHLVLNDASRLHHFLWYMNTRMNWGEPWGKSMRTGQVEGRIKNQKFFEKNLFPKMLGWFLIRKANRRFEASTLMDIEWALSEAAGFDAGFSMSISENVLDSLGNIDILLEAIKNWERLRFENRFPDELKEELRKPETEWHLKKVDDHHFELYPMAVSQPFVCDLLEMQPGQPGGADWYFENCFEEQPLKFQMRVEGYGFIEKVQFYTKKGLIKFDATVKGGQYLLFDGEEAWVTDRNFNRQGKAEYAGSCPLVKGKDSFSFGCTFGGEEGPEVSVQVITQGEAYHIMR